MEADERAIRGLHSTWIDAVNAGDLDRLLNLMTADAVLLNPGQVPVDRDGFSSSFLAAPEQAQIVCTSELEEVVVTGDVGYTRSRDAVSVTPWGNAETTQLIGYRMTIYRRQPDGRWLLARDAPSLSEVDTSKT